MLILSRRNGESFFIGEDIKITVLSQRSNQVRIGIDAPRSLPVHREEVLERQRAKDAHSQACSKEPPQAAAHSHSDAQSIAETNKHNEHEPEQL